jgi:hypothetical protein
MMVPDPWPPATNEDIRFDFDYYTQTSVEVSENKTSYTAAFQLVESVVGREAAACVVQKMRHVARNVTSTFRRITSDGEDANWTWLWYLVTRFIPRAYLGTRRRLQHELSAYRAIHSKSKRYTERRLTGICPSQYYVPGGIWHTSSGRIGHVLGLDTHNSQPNWKPVQPGSWGAR